MTLKPDEVQGRVVLVAALFRVGMPRLAAALAPKPPTAATKERFFAAVEEGVWALPDEVFADFEGDDAWAEHALAKGPVKALLDRAIMEGVTSQP